MPLGDDVVIATPDPGKLASIELGLGLVIGFLGDIVAIVTHAGIVARGGGPVNGPAVAALAGCAR